MEGTTTKEMNREMKEIVELLNSAFKKYTKKVVGYPICLNHVGIYNLKDFDNWIKNDLYFREWFKKEYNYWLKFEGDDLVLIDLRFSDLKKYRNQKLEPPRKFAEPRDVDDLKPEI